MEAVQSLSQLQGLAVTQREIADDLPTFSNDSDQFHNLELFLCGQNSSGEAGLVNVFRRLTEGDKYQQGELADTLGSFVGFLKKQTWWS